MHTCITTISFVVLVNEGLSFFFKASRGLRQEDLLLPLLFTIVMETLNKLLIRAGELEFFTRVTEEVTHLFFVDDSLIFWQPDEKIILNLRCVLLCFQSVSELNINLSS